MLSVVIILVGFFISAFLYKISNQLEDANQINNNMYRVVHSQMLEQKAHIQAQAQHLQLSKESMALSNQLTATILAEKRAQTVKDHKLIEDLAERKRQQMLNDLAAEDAAKDEKRREEEAAKPKIELKKKTNQK